MYSRPASRRSSPVRHRRGLLRTRYPDSGRDQAPRTGGAEPPDAPYDSTFVPLTSPLKEHTS